MAPPTHPAWLLSKRTPVTRRMPSSTMMAPPKELGLWPGRFVRLPAISPPCRTAVESRTDMAPPRSCDELPRNELLTKVALEPSSTFTAPPPVAGAAARLLTNEQSLKRASDFDIVTPPEVPLLPLKPF